VRWCAMPHNVRSWLWREVPRFHRLRPWPKNRASASRVITGVAGRGDSFGAGKGSPDQRTGCCSPARRAPAFLGRERGGRAGNGSNRRRMHLTTSAGVCKDCTRFAIRPTKWTEAMAHYLLMVQRTDGSWRTYDRRPPIQDGPLMGTALALRACSCIRSPDARPNRSKASNAPAAAGAFKASDTNERVFQLLGLSWSGEPPARLQKYVKRILRRTARRRRLGAVAGPRK